MNRVGARRCADTSCCRITGTRCSSEISGSKSFRRGRVPGSKHPSRVAPKKPATKARRHEGRFVQSVFLRAVVSSWPAFLRVSTVSLYGATIAAGKKKPAVSRCKHANQSSRRDTIGDSCNRLVRLAHLADGLDPLHPAH